MLQFVIPGYHVAALPLDPTNNPLSNTITQYKGAWMDNYYQHLWMWIAPALGFFGPLFAYINAKNNCKLKCFYMSVMGVIGAVSSIGFSLFPFLMPSSTFPNQSLLVWNSASSQLSLEGILLVALVMLPIIFYYTNFVYKKLWGRDRSMSESVVTNENHSLY